MKDPTLLQAQGDVRELIDIVRELRQANDPDDREALLVQLAEHWLLNHDFSDMNLCEHYHNVFQSLYLLQQKYRMAALHAGRLVLDVVPEGEEDVDVPPGPDESKLN